jgi:hypothetical protein
VLELPLLPLLELGDQKGLHLSACTRQMDKGEGE